MAAPSMSRKSTLSESSANLNLRPILDVVKKINSERNLRRLVTMILETAIEFSNATRGSLAIFKGESFNAELSRHRTRGEINHSEIPSLAAVLRRVHKSHEGVVVDDLSKDDILRPPALVPGVYGL